MGEVLRQPEMIVVAIAVLGQYYRGLISCFMVAQNLFSLLLYKILVMRLLPVLFFAQETHVQ